ncbi:MAG: class I SAM-dependent methyltransferase [bacterium]
MLHILEKESSYELLDSGEGMKLERFGDFVLSRPDPEALWKKSLPSSNWKKAHASYVRDGKTGQWQKDLLPKNWNIVYHGLTFELRPTSFKHVGIFPEQKIHWSWLEEKIKKEKTIRETPIKVLNLFAYTGGASLVCARAGAEVTHVDASSVSVLWARKNAELSGLADAPIRWITDDVLQFLRREVRRKNTYDVVLMDPPSFGHGPKGTVWKIENDFYELMNLVSAVLSDKPLAVIVNGYTAGYSPVTLKNNLLEFKDQYGGDIESGELVVSENNEKMLPSGVFARWSA